MDDTELAVILFEIGEDAVEYYGWLLIESI